MSFQHLELSRHYDSDSADGLLDVYQTVVKESRRYDRLTGFFSSSIYAAVEFLLSDSWRQPEKSLRIVCSPQLSHRDIEAISAGYALRDVSEASIITAIDEMWLRSDESNLGVRVLATLIANGQLEIRIATPRSGRGMYHSKIGLCEDFEGNWLYFHGSANESFQGLALNWETLDFKFGWGSDDDLRDIEHWKKRFDDAWSNNLVRFDVAPFPQIGKDKLSQYALDEPQQVADELSRFLGRTKPKHRTAQTGLPPLFRHQEEVLESWKENGYRGIVDHVTGAGKTITALTAIRDHCAAGLPALVLVPRDGLQAQWIQEIELNLGSSVSILAVGGSLGAGGRWIPELPRHTAPDTSLGGRITVAVLKSGAGSDFIRKMRTGSHLLVVADEVHNMGSPTGQRVLDALEKTHKRLGLSATYQRANDEAGTTAIEQFFGPVLPPRFGIKEAITAGRLVPYYYDFEVCNLTHDETERFAALTRKIMNLSKRDEPDNVAALKTLLAQRAKVIKGASNKVTLVADVFKKYYSGDDRWLVYCDDKNQLEQVFQVLTAAGYPCAKFYADMIGSKAETLAYLTIPGKVVVAIKCLDEGINIPEVDKALILASSTNPREYIQRRGRVLRKSDNKTKATIIDVLVLDNHGNPALRSEVDRMNSFLDDAMNSAARIKLLGYLSGGLLESALEDFEEEEGEQ